MLKDKIQSYVQAEISSNGDSSVVFKEELDYAKEHMLIEGDLNLQEKDGQLRFSDAYIERGDKATDEFLGEESSASFLNQPITYFKQHMNEFMYVESEWFEFIDVESVSFEVDDLFKTYDVLIGLKKQKKHEKTIKSYFEQRLHGEDARLSPMFNQKDGIWEINFTFNHVEGFQEEMSIGEAYQLIYQLLFGLVHTIES
ncbi:branched-chain amino acid aminotransferase [Cytobacillus purgationiresistens]|uniref:Branched-chain amino acid aminotransferase n=1 Tax=Cytobacillus purgationiresistens TaxID=863449 RepID=A0ABU0AB55_9BACI|nr:branched-chain amino acid aminotransferase [Cytobacillus purgationiresistens]MDQ0268481.1 hypothetical protein [Cytobacillus purgationiresistens]